MKRRVIKQGNNTLTITLPRKWASSANIKAGDELDIIEEGNNLKILINNLTKEPKKITLDFSQSSETVINSLLAVAHKNGYDEVEVIFSDPKTVKIIQKRINSMLMGYEIVEQTSKRCVIKNVSGWHSGEFDNLVRRIFLVTLTLAKNSLETIQSGQYDNLNELLVLEETNNKLTNYCHALLNRKIFDGQKTTFFYHITWLLEKIGDEYKDLCLYLLENKKVKLSKETIHLYEDTNQLLDDYYHLFYAYDLPKLEKVYQKHNISRKELTKLIGSKKAEEIPVIVNLLLIVQKTHNCFGSTSCLNHLNN